MIKGIPILFSTPMVQALLAGRKTQTRRLVNPQPSTKASEFAHHPLQWPKKPWVARFKYHLEYSDIYEVTDAYKCRYGRPGDLLWVRETWGVGSRPDPFTGSVDGFEYKADQAMIDEIESLPIYPCDDFDFGNYDKKGWRPSIHMPKVAARIWLQVESVRAERLQEISEADAISEGIVKIDYGIQTPDGSASIDGGKTFHPFKPRQVFGYSENPLARQDQSLRTARTAFGNLWERINGPNSWQANSWLWVVQFKVLSTTGKPDLL